MGSLRQMLDELGAERSADGALRGFGDPEAEYTAAVEAAGLADLSDRSRVEVAGPDAGKLLQNLCTCDLKDVAVGAGNEAFFLNQKGRMLAAPRVFATPEGFWLDLEPGQGPGFLRHLDQFHFREDLSLRDATEATAQLHLCGPKAAAVLRVAVGDTIPELADLQHMARSVGGVDCQVRRHDRGPEIGFDVVCPAADAPAVWRSLADPGSKIGLRPIGTDALRVLRVEAGIPAYGVDLTEENLAQEAARPASAISFTKGCYLGQETVARLDALGHVNRVVRGVRLDGPLEAPGVVELEEKAIGTITSVANSPRAGGWIGLGMIRVAPETGSLVTIRPDGGEPVGGRLSELPFR